MGKGIKSDLASARKTTKDITKAVGKLKSLTEIVKSSYTNITINGRCNSIYLESVESVKNYIPIVKSKAENIKLIAENFDELDKSKKFD